MSSAPLCQVLVQITAVNHRAPKQFFYKKRFRVREFRGPLDQIETKNIQPLLRYEIQLLRFEATGFWCRWKNQTHKLVYLMGQHWPSLGLLPSGHQCREFGVIQQVSTELLRSFVKRTWEARLITIFWGPKEAQKDCLTHMALEKKEMKLPAGRAGHIVTCVPMLFKMLSRLGVLHGMIMFCSL